MAPGQKEPHSENIHWHPAFFEAFQQDLSEYKESLEFKYEYQLTDEPLRIDTLIIKNPAHIKIDKNFARIFLKDNICEFKSPHDYLSVNDFYKVYAYACLYTAITPDVAISDITLTFIETKYPRELVTHLQEVRHYPVTEPWPGIYQVTGDILPIQLIETKKLSETDSLWLKNLNSGLDISSVKTILKEAQSKGKDAQIRAYLNAILRANPQAIKEVLTMSDETLTLDDVLMEAGYIPRWLEKGREEGREKGIEEEAAKIAKNMLKRGLSIEEIAQDTELPLDKVRALAAKP